MSYLYQYLKSPQHISSSFFYSQGIGLKWLQCKLMKKIITPCHHDTAFFYEIQSKKPQSNEVRK